MIDNSIRQILSKDIKLIYLGAMVLLVINGGLAVLLVGLINRTVSSDSMNIPVTNVLFFLVLIIVLAVVGTCAHIVMGRIGETIIYKMRFLLFKRILATDIEKQDLIGGHKIYSSVTQDVDAISGAIAVFPLVATSVAVLAGGALYLSLLSLGLFLYVLFFVSAGIAVIRSIIKIVRKYMTLTRKRQDILYRHYDALIYGAKEIHINSNLRKHFVSNMVKITLSSIRIMAIKARVMWALALTSGNSLLYLTILGVLVIGYNFMEVEPGVITGYVVAMFFLESSVRVLITLMPVLFQGNVALNKVKSLDLNDSDIDAFERPSGGPICTNNWQRVRMIDVEYEYPGNADKHKFHFGPVTIDVQAGEVVFVVGGNGSGKSTFIKLISGLYRPTGGEIILNDERVDDSSLEILRNHFSAVFSDYYLFEDVLDKSGQPAPDDKVQPFLKVLDLSNSVSSAQGKLSSVRLSQGQRRRLALLAALLSDRPIFLFDEWTADQDSHFKKYFYHVIVPDLKAKGKAVIVVSHDNRFFSIADRVYRLEAGKLVNLPVGVSSAF